MTRRPAGDRPAAAGDLDRNAAHRRPTADEPDDTGEAGEAGEAGDTVTPGDDVTTLGATPPERAAGTQSHVRFSEILTEMDLGALMLDRSGVVLFINDFLLRILGRDRAEVLGRDWIETVVPVDERDRLRAVLDEAIAAGGVAGRREDGVLTASGETRRLAWTSATLRGADGSVAGFASIAHDVTHARRVEDERTVLAAAIEQSDQAVVITDADGRITYVNAAFERNSGYKSAEVVGLNPRFLKSTAQSATFFDAMWAAISNGLPWVADMTNRRKDGSLYHLRAVISPIRAADKSITGYVSVARDVTHDRELETRTELLTRERALISDTLQRLPSGATLEATAELFCRQVRSMSDVSIASLIIFEGDGIAVPLAYVGSDGRDVELRRQTAGWSRYLRDRANSGPWVEVWRGHRDHPYDTSLRKAGVEAIAYAPVIAGGTVIGVLAVGSSEDDAMSQLSGQLGAIVDFANLAGALLGRQVGDDREGRRVRTVIERVIAEGAFKPVFQSIVDMMRNRTLGYEALTRFTDQVAPDVRFAEADAVGLGVQLERVTLKAALEAAARMPPSRFIHLNVSPALVMAGTDLRELLSGAPARIVLEVTEHAAVGDYAAFRSAIDAIGRPVLLAVDDAGAGFASFRHILELRPAFVKLDVSLVRGLDADPAKQALVAGMRHFARMTNRRLIAEGVETEAEAAALRALDVRLGQGYLFDRPEAAPTG